MGLSQKEIKELLGKILKDAGKNGKIEQMTASQVIDMYFPDIDSAASGNVSNFSVVLKKMAGDGLIKEGEPVRSKNKSSRKCSSFFFPAKQGSCLPAETPSKPAEKKEQPEQGKKPVKKAVKKQEEKAKPSDQAPLKKVSEKKPAENKNAVKKEAVKKVSDKKAVGTEAKKNLPMEKKAEAKPASKPAEKKPEPAAKSKEAKGTAEVSEAEKALKVYNALNDRKSEKALEKEEEESQIAIIRIYNELSVVLDTLKNLREKWINVRDKVNKDCVYLTDSKKLNVKTGAQVIAYLDLLDRDMLYISISEEKK